jgi:two-component system, OmpR family, sensor histidine kinase MtrB
MSAVVDVAAGTADAAKPTEPGAPTLTLTRPAPRQRLGLRRRIMLIFTLGALMLSLFLAFVTYGFARSSVVQQREQAALDTAEQNAVTANNALGSNTTDAKSAIVRLQEQGVERPLIWFGSGFTPAPGGFDDSALPQELVDRVIGDGVAQYMRVDVEGSLYIVVGQPLPPDAAYFEFFSLDEVGDTLQGFRLSLLLGTVITTALGVLAGQFAARRAVRPVGVAAQAAKAIAGGRLDTRLEPTDDPDLSVLANSFNDMASALQTRIERDARFASDVSHELRSPLMTLSASVEVMDARRDDMPERAQVALDLLKSDVVRFQGLVEDLLEISRFDAGAVRLHMEELLAAEFVRNAIAVSSLPSAPITVSPTGAASPASSPTSSTTPASTAAARPRSRSARSSPTANPSGTSTSPSRTTARASPTTNGRSCSSGSLGVAWRDAVQATTAPASGCRSSTSTCACTAVGSGSRTGSTASPAPGS